MTGGVITVAKCHHPNWKQMRYVQHWYNHRAQLQAQKQATRGKGQQALDVPMTKCDNQPMMYSQRRRLLH